MKQKGESFVFNGITVGQFDLFNEVDVTLNFAQLLQRVRTCHHVAALPRETDAMTFDDFPESWKEQKERIHLLHDDGDIWPRGIDAYAAWNAETKSWNQGSQNLVSMPLTRGETIVLQIIE